MAVPIVKYGELAHLFCIGADSDRPYSAEDISLAKLVISQAALLFEREKSLLNATRLLTMGNMISEISHDLRKPLTSIKGGLQIVTQRYPEIQKEDLIPGDSGVRALAVGRNGEMIDDFVFAENEWAINVLNAPSPAATACLSIGESVAEKALKRFI